MAENLLITSNPTLFFSIHVAFVYISILEIICTSGSIASPHGECPYSDRLPAYVWRAAVVRETPVGVDHGDFGFAVEGALSCVCDAAEFGEEGLEDPAVEGLEPV